jgi:Methyltransferase domain
MLGDVMRQAYTLVPRAIRTRIYKAVASRVKNDEVRSLEEMERRYPKVDLRAEHIKNLKTVLDKSALLDLLPKHSVVAEIGVSKGDYSQKILSITEPKQLHLIDAWANEAYRDLGDLVRNRFAREIDLVQVVIHEGYSTKILPGFADGYFDWVYIDTSHDYENTVKELELARRKVKTGGLIAGHDYVLGHWPTRTRYGVIEAVNEFCVTHNWEMIYLTCEHHQHRSYVLSQNATL